ncbi:hypothetical protein Bca4012_076459 [Brassica carinata]
MLSPLDLALLVIVGPRRVAEYEFLCRTRFSIGSTTYIVDGTQTEANRAEYERLVFGDRAKETERVMNARFSEETIMLFHRVSCEMAYADQIGGNQPSNNQPSRDIIVVEDNDDVMYDANNVNLETGQNSHAVGGLTPEGTNLLTVPITQVEAPSIFWDVGMDLRVIASGIEVDEQLNINAPAEVEMELVGGVISLAEGNDNAGGDTIQNQGVVKEIGEVEGGSSSTGSTNNVGSVFGNEGGGSGARNSPRPVDHDIRGESGEIGPGGEGMHTTSGEQGFQVSRPRVLQVNPSHPSPPLFMFTQGGQAGEPSGVREVIKDDKDTSSEASDIDGGF